MHCTHTPTPPAMQGMLSVWFLGKAPLKAEMKSRAGANSTCVQGRHRALNSFGTSVDETGARSRLERRVLRRADV